jgi:Response regulator of the LytR/AlgR family
MGMDAKDKGLRIAICEDDAAFLQVLQERVRRFFEDNSIPIELTQFLGGEELLAWDELNTIDILIMDIEMKTTNGLDVAYQVRAVNPKFLLVFVTAFIQYAPQGYEVAFRYVLKDRFEETIEPALKDVIHELGYNRETIELDFVTGPKTLFVEDIAYIESEKHANNFYGATDNFLGRLYSTISDMEAVFRGEQFVRPHMSYIVNLKHVFRMEPMKLPTHFIMGGGKIIPISQRKQAATKKAYYMYIGKDKPSTR